MHNNLLIILIILEVVFGITLHEQAYAQSYFIYPHQIRFLRNDMEIDSIFQKFKNPKFPEEYRYPYPELWSKVIIGVYVIADTNQRVESISFVPFYKIGNGFDEKSLMWSALKDSILNVSRSWVFKPVYWKTLDDVSLEMKEYVTKINHNNKYLPNGGKQEHFIILYFGNEFDEKGFQFFYQIKGE